MRDILLIAIIAGAASFFLTWMIRRYALSGGMLDVPNERSSHVHPTPRGGGAAIVLVATLAWFWLAVSGTIRFELFIALAGGGVAVALVGFFDDRGGVSARVRLAVHFVAALWALAWLDGLPPLQLGNRTIVFGWFGYAIGALGIVWTLNLFNFMDGIDGIAASEAIFITLSGSALILLSQGSGPIPDMSVALAAACWGFLLWNWSPAKIFMGDVGSGYLGYVIAVLVLVAARDSPVAIYVWLILGAIFFVDATVTLVRRLIAGSRVYEAHRSHAYQILARKFGSHRKVAIMVLAINCGVLLPLAWLATRAPASAWLIAVLAVAGLAFAVVSVGAGRDEPR